MTGENQTAAAKVDDGGGAFPKATIVGVHGEVVDVVTTGGMSLRDYFAAKAMQAIISTSQSSGDADDLLDGTPLNGPESTSRLDVALGWVPVTAYAYADAMLAARKGGGE